MKRYGLLLFIILVLSLSICSCSSDKENENKISDSEVNQETEKTNVSGEDKYLIEGFTDCVSENPIDKDYKKHEYDGNTGEYTSVLMKFVTFWQDEMEYATDVLLPLLSEEDKIIFMESQENWEEYYQGNYEIQISFFRKYNYEVIGTDHWMAVQQENLEKTRDRTLEIIEYIYAAGGEYEFLYSSSGE